MKLDGMDAAKRGAAAPAYPLEQTYGDGSAAANGLKEANSADRGGSADKAAKMNKNPNAQPTQFFEKQALQQDENVSEKVIQEAVDKANRVLFGSDRKFEISFHEKTRELMVKVVDTRTNETIREIPPKKIVDLVVNLCEMAGILFDEKG
ncbi:MAG: flagellar protein FlaG [Clostridiales bacterium]|jgi:flagellar protein FlaG|nr:flagellar protein FlaG [Clostridiales bacterium]